MTARILFCLLLFAGGAFAEDAFAAEEDANAWAGKFGATLRFDFLYNGTKVGDVTETFVVDESGGYVLESHAAATGLAAILYGDVFRRSSGHLDAEFGFVPERYEEKRGRRPRQAAEFDRSRSALVLSRGEDESREEKLQGVVYDYLNALYLSHVMGRPTAGTLSVTNGWRLQSYGYENAGEETLQTPLGDLETIRISRTDGKTRIFWLAKELDYLPVRIYVDDKGHIFESALVGAETRKNPAP